MHDYKLTNEEESREYNEKDVLHRIRLYNEHSYPNGIVIVKKDAKINAGTLEWTSFLK